MLFKNQFAFLIVNGMNLSFFEFDSIHAEWLQLSYFQALYIRKQTLIVFLIQKMTLRQFPETL